MDEGDLVGIEDLLNADGRKLISFRTAASKYSGQNIHRSLDYENYEKRVQAAFAERAKERERKKAIERAEWVQKVQAYYALADKIDIPLTSTLSEASELIRERGPSVSRDGWFIINNILRNDKLVLPTYLRLRAECVRGNVPIMSQMFPVPKFEDLYSSPEEETPYVVRPFVSNGDNSFERHPPRVNKACSSAETDYTVPSCEDAKEAVPATETVFEEEDMSGLIKKLGLNDASIRFCNELENVLNDDFVLDDSETIQSRFAQSIALLKKLEQSNNRVASAAIKILRECDVKIARVMTKNTRYRGLLDRSLVLVAAVSARPDQSSSPMKSQAAAVCARPDQSSSPPKSQAAAVCARPDQSSSPPKSQAAAVCARPDQSSSPPKSQAAAVCARPDQSSSPPKSQAAADSANGPSDKTLKSQAQAQTQASVPATSNDCYHTELEGSEPDPWAHIVPAIPGSLRVTMHSVRVPEDSTANAQDSDGRASKRRRSSSSSSSGSDHPVLTQKLRKQASGPNLPTFAGETIPRESRSLPGPELCATESRSTAISRRSSPPAFRAPAMVVDGRDDAEVHAESSLADIEEVEPSLPKAQFVLSFKQGSRKTLTDKSLTDVISTGIEFLNEVEFEQISTKDLDRRAEWCKQHYDEFESKSEVILRNRKDGVIDCLICPLCKHRVTGKYFSNLRLHFVNTHWKKTKCTAIGCNKRMAHNEKNWHDKDNDDGALCPAHRPQGCACCERPVKQESDAV